MEEADRALALALQEEYDRENANPGDDFDQFIGEISSGVSPKSSGSSGERPKSIVDPAWELLDPSPDVRVLFQEFNAMYFWGKLSMVEVRWSPRMTLCAGLCCYEGRGGLCSIRLSKPLLQLRPRKDLVETLLHEMIHALLFVTDNNKDHDGHGPEFCKHMYRINKETGTNITIYHNFHDEVDQLRQHWWRCQGSCRTKPPYFGFVKRSMNRAPSPRDTWWSRHQMTCGGTYIKVKEPENYGKKKEKPKEKGVREITPFLSQASKEETKQVVPSNPVQSGSNIIGESSKEGHRLGGHQSLQGDTCGRGIPAHSRLLAKLDKNANITKPNVSSSSNILQSPAKEKKQPAFDDKWGSLLSQKRKNGIVKSATPKKKAKGEITIPELLERMKRKGKKSVNAGAPAFHCTPLVSSYSKHSIYFPDSQGSSEQSQSDKENEDGKINVVKNEKIPTSTSNRSAELVDDLPISVKNESIVLIKEDKDASMVESSSTKIKTTSNLPSLDTDSEEECSLTFILNRNKRQNGLLKTGNLHPRTTLLSDDDDDLPQIEFSLNHQTKVGETSSLNNNTDKSPLDSNVNARKRGSLSKRLPSLSESDSENIVEKESTLLKLPSKRLKIDKPEDCSATGTMPNTSTCNSNVLQSESKTEHVVDTAPCPICCTEVPIYSINSHIDECLSLKAIRDSAFD